MLGHFKNFSLQMQYKKKSLGLFYTLGFQFCAKHRLVITTKKEGGEDKENV